MKSSECQLLAVLGVRRTPLAPSLADRPDRGLCACLDVSGYHKPSRLALLGAQAFLRGVGIYHSSRSRGAGRFVAAPKVRHL